MLKDEQTRYRAEQSPEKSVAQRRAELMPRIQVDRVSMLRRADAPPRRAELRPRIQVDRVSMLRRANAPPRRAELRPRLQVDRVSTLKMSK